ncbi:4Fe-4S single cluster domain-containing protein [Pseudodesulfovibrio thermohalotolerans]|uniref:4Fe-4S single cluster domain-containing protein n=1 Tax=Pseudodesulfovibrio thermohalotolerans TaxID=2880651 RepID=UPI00384BA6B1
MIRINSLDLRGSVCDGPGLRTVLFLQGCQRRCPNCHNPETWDSESGRLIPILDLAARIRIEAPTRRLTISGGEPLEQTVGVLALLNELSDFDLALYTGYELEEVPPSILRRLDWIKVGSFDIHHRTTTTPFIGSGNQRFLSTRDELVLLDD